jgi:hypothetical protein
LQPAVGVSVAIAIRANLHRCMSMTLAVAWTGRC